MITVYHIGAVHAISIIGLNKQKVAVLLYKTVDNYSSI
jgi:hypothetical protein